MGISNAQSKRTPIVYKVTLLLCVAVLFQIISLRTEAEPPVVETAVATEPAYSEEAIYIAKTIWGEARGCSVYEQEQVVWCILNRVDSDDPRFSEGIVGVITQPFQFHGYSEDNPVVEEHYNLALDVLARWEAEKRGEDGLRNLAPEYLFFGGDGEHNYFRTEY